MSYCWKRLDNTCFINPYNFIPLGKGKRPAPKREGSLLTGYIECTLTPKTDLFIPNTSSEDTFDLTDEEGKKEHKSYEFFSYRNLEGRQSEDAGRPRNPVVPGSELRGVIRSEYEALTDSCLSLDYDEILSARDQDFHKTPGIVSLENGEWVLYSAQRIKLEKPDGLKTGDIVDFKKDSAPSGFGFVASQLHRITDFSKYRGNSETIPAWKQALMTFGDTADESSDCELKMKALKTSSKLGVVLIGESAAEGSNKKYEHIFTCKSEAGRGPRIADAMERLKLALELYRNDKMNQNPDSEKKGWYKDYPVSGTSPIPVWYETDSAGEYYFSPACRGKNAFGNELARVVSNRTKGSENPEEQSYLPCKNENKLCSACALFGTVEETGTETVGALTVSSRLRFTDAVFCGDQPPEYGEQETLRELAGPKPQCAEFYTSIPNGKNKSWNYRYVYERRGQKQTSISDQITLNGRKFYLHHTYVPSKGEAKTKRNCTVRPLKASDANRFGFRVYFDRIAEIELKRLLVVLSCGDNSGTRYHKIGMGKPLGLGSVRIRVEEIKLRDLQAYLDGNPLPDATEQYRPYFGGYFENQFKEEDVFGTDGAVLSSYLKLLDFYAVDSRMVSYPIAKDESAKKDNREASYHWFIGARDRSRGAIPCVALPPVSTSKKGSDLCQPKMVREMEKRK